MQLVEPASRFAPRPEPPYYAVIFASQRRGGDTGGDTGYGEVGYGEMADRMGALAAQQPGYLGVESARDAAGFGITVSYWSSLESIAAWRRNAEHTLARESGRASWYSGYELRVARIERAYGWRADAGAPQDPGL